MSILITSSKKLVILIMLLIIASSLIAQEVKGESESSRTKIDAFTSKTGVIRKFIDVSLPDLKGMYLTTAETRIRRISNTTDELFFYQIVKTGKYDKTTASIEYSDLLEVIKALETLSTEITKDINLNPEYLENKFITEDGFMVGYLINKGKPTWFLTLEKHGSDNTLFVNSVDILTTAFVDAKVKIESLKK